jgi:hypothetical protein
VTPSGLAGTTDGFSGGWISYSKIQQSIRIVVLAVYIPGSVTVSHFPWTASNCHGSDLDKRTCTDNAKDPDSSISDESRAWREIVLIFLSLQQNSSQLRQPADARSLSRMEPSPQSFPRVSTISQSGLCFRDLSEHGPSLPRMLGRGTQLPSKYMRDCFLIKMRPYEICIPFSILFLYFWKVVHGTGT